MRISDWSSDVCSSVLRHILVPRLQRRIAPQREYLRAGAVLIELARPIIVDLMVVERAGEGARRVRRLQGRIALVLGVAAPVVVDAADLAAAMLGNDRHTVRRRTARGRHAIIKKTAQMEEQ